MRNRIQNKILMLRISVLKYLLGLMNFREVTGHLIYTGNITSNSIIVDFLSSPKGTRVVALNVLPLT